MSTLAMLRASWRSWFSQDFRVVGPAWLQYFWTVAFCAMVAAGLALLSFAANAAGRRNWDVDEVLYFRADASTPACAPNAANT